MRIIYVEDEKKWRDNVRDALGDRDILVNPFSDGKAALQYIRETPGIEAGLIDYHLLVEGTDEKQPLQGYDLCPEIEKIRPGLPQFLLSEYPEREARAKQDVEIVNEKIREMLNRCHLPLDRYFQKKREFKFMDFDDMARKIQAAILGNQRIRTIFDLDLDRRNRKNTRLLNQYYREYEDLRLSPEWSRINQHISQEAEELIERFENNDPDIGGQTLGQFCPIRSLKKALVIRRAVIGMVAKHGGNLFKTVVYFNYGWPRTILKGSSPVDNEMSVNVHGSFKKYLYESLCLDAPMLQEQEGLLFEEEEWFDRYCKKLHIGKYGRHP